MKLDALAKFWMTYGIHALPKEETNREVRAAQMEAWLEDPTKEIDNDFSSYVEFFFKSDPSWVMWQYCNSYDDWCAKKGKKDLRHTLKSKFTGDTHQRMQPSEDSEGMRVYLDYQLFCSKIIDDKRFVTVFRKLANKHAKAMDILPTWSLTTGPKKRKRVVDVPDSGDESDAPIVCLLASEKSLSKSVQSYAHCYDEGDEMTKYFMSI